MNLRFDGGEHAVDMPAAHGMAGGDRVSAMVRPECVRVGVEATAQKDVTLPGTITDTVFAGEKVSVYVQTSIGVVVASLLNPTRQGSGAMAAGTDVPVSWRKDDLLIFHH
jgi:ABC-type Fe3+/spermidine/putrescine transport system ATPase subunit